MTKGPATEALERSLKRKRSRTCSDDQLKAQSFPSLENVFADLPGQEDFPSIGWDFDDQDEIDSTQDIHRTIRLATDSVVSRKRHKTNSLARSKSFRTDLCAMNEGAVSLTERAISTKLEPLSPFEMRLDFQFSLKFEPTSSLANSTSSGKRFTHSFLPPVGFHFAR
jgi:hypothetical protein